MQFPICLHEVQLPDAGVSLFVPEREAVKEAYETGAIAFPYWSQVWPAAKALAQFITANPGYTIAKHVLELGAGLGLPSLVAAQNAKTVVCTDYVADAAEVVKQSAVRLGLQNFTANVLDWRQLPHGLEADVLLLSDVNYAPVVFPELMNVIVSFLQKGAVVLLSTPQRLVAKDFVASLAKYHARQEEISVLHDGNDVPITVLVLRQ